MMTEQFFLVLEMRIESKITEYMLKRGNYIFWLFNLGQFIVLVKI